MDQGELKQRTKTFALRIIRLVEGLSSSIVGRTIANQLVRSGTSVAANYRAACRGRSKAEFIAKLGIVVEEVDETAFWLELIVDSGLQPHARIASLLKEADKLTAIFVASCRSTKRRKDPQSTIGHQQ